MRFRNAVDVGSLCWRYGRQSRTLDWDNVRKVGREMEIQSEGSGCVSKQVEEITSVSRRSSISGRPRKVTVEDTICGSADVDLVFA